MNGYEQNQEQQKAPIVNKMTFGDAFSAILSNLFDFSGRARRKEYWTFMLLYFALLLGAILVDAEAGFKPTYDNTYGPVFLVVYFVLLLPRLAIIFRRFHDCGYSWTYIFWVLVPIVGGFIVLFATLEDSQKEANEYGDSPKYGVLADDFSA